MYIKQKTLLIIFLLFGIQSYSQTYNNYYINDFKINPADTNKLILEFENINFLQNNEYFGDIVNGYTLLGFNLAPKFTFSPNSKIKLSAGANLLSYYGREDEIEFSLLLSFQYKLLPKLDFILGNIYGTVNHKLIDPLFNFERYFNNNVENGVQFLWSGEKVFADLWLDWEQQIFSGDPFQEKFNVGLSSQFTLFENERFNFSIPFQNLVRHQGGEINSNKSSNVLSIYNNALGLSLHTNLKNRFIQDLTLSSYWVNYKDLSTTKEQMFIDGMGSYTTFVLANDYVDLLVGYWYGEQFIAPIGNPIYESYSRTNIFVEEPIRQMITGKLNFQKDVFKGINLGARFETYYDLLNTNFDYTWCIVVVINSKFFLRQY